MNRLSQMTPQEIFAEMEQLKLEKTMVQNQNRSLKVKNNKLKEMNEQSNALPYYYLQGFHSAMKHDYKDLKKENEKLKLDNSTLETENAFLSVENNNLEKKNATLNAKLDVVDLSKD